MRVEVGEVGVPALRSYPWKRGSASSVGQVVAVGLPTVVVPGGKQKFLGSRVFIDAAASGANTAITYRSESLRHVSNGATINECTGFDLCCVLSAFLLWTQPTAAPRHVCLC